MSEKSVLDLAEKLQKEAHEYIANIKNMNDNISYEDAFNAWLYFKLAEIIIKQNK